MRCVFFCLHFGSYLMERIFDALSCFEAVSIRLSTGKHESRFLAVGDN